MGQQENHNIAPITTMGVYSQFGDITIKQELTELTTNAKAEQKSKENEWFNKQESKIIKKIRSIMDNKHFMKNRASQGIDYVDFSMTSDKIKYKLNNNARLDMIKNIKNSLADTGFSIETDIEIPYAEGESVLCCVCLSVIFPPVGIPMLCHELYHRNRWSIKGKISWNNVPDDV